MRHRRWRPMLAGAVALTLEFATPFAVAAILRYRARPAAPVAAQSCVPAPRAVCRAGTPTPAGVGTSAAPAALFARYAATTVDGWTGGDSTYSLRLPDGRILWLFSDTLLGARAVLVNNAFVIQDGTRLSTVYGGRAGHPTAIMPPPAPDRWYWTGDGMLTGDGLVQVVFREYQRTGPGTWDFRYLRGVVATFSPDRLTVPSSVDPLPSATGVGWGAALLPASRSGDGYTYVYGVVGTGAGKAMRVARVAGSDLRHGPWQYRSACGWSTDEAAASDVLTGVADEYSVGPWRGGFLLVTADGAGFGTGIDMLVACTPAGPFTRRTTVYRMPEAGPAGSYHDASVIAYNPHAHPELSTGDAILVSYNVNRADGALDPGVYRPRFVTVRLAPSPASGPPVRPGA